jgi:hypothetical protein
MTWHNSVNLTGVMPTQLIGEKNPMIKIRKKNEIYQKEPFNRHLF